MAKIDYEAVAPAVDDLEEIASAILLRFPDARIFALHGEMGVGKTTMVRYFCRQLGIIGPVTSPTFSIVNEYTGKGHIQVYHFDFYRIRKIEEVFDVGYEEYFFSGHYCFIEWPGKLEFLLPVDSISIFLEEHGGKRHFRVTQRSIPPS